MFISQAFAQTETAPAAGAAAQPMAAFDAMQLLLFGAIFVIFWFFMIRPQQQRAKQHQKMLDAVKKGDCVLTSGGIIGTVTKVETLEVMVEIADGVRVRLQKSALASVLTTTTSAAANDTAA